MRYAFVAALLAVAAIIVGSMAGRMAVPANMNGGDGVIVMEQAEPMLVTSGVDTDQPFGSVVIERSGDSHFYADADIDGTSVRMVVDSGASSVVLTRNDAEMLGIAVESLPVSGQAQTAGGMVPVRAVMLDEVAVGDVSVKRVAAAVIETDMPQSLLGQSFLARLDSVAVEGDTMTLR